MKVKLCFCLTGAIANESALFTYDSEYLLETYYRAPRHDTSFIPVFLVPESPDDPLANQAATICSGGGSQFCRYEWKLWLAFYYYNNKLNVSVMFLWSISASDMSVNVKRWNKCVLILHIKFNSATNTLMMSHVQCIYYIILHWVWKLHIDCLPHTGIHEKYWVAFWEIIWYMAQLVKRHKISFSDLCLCTVGMTSW